MNSEIKTMSSRKNWAFTNAHLNKSNLEFKKYEYVKKKKINLLFSKLVTHTNKILFAGMEGKDLRNWLFM